MFDETSARLASHKRGVVSWGDTTHCTICDQTWDTNDTEPPWCKPKPGGYATGHKPGGITPIPPPPMNSSLLIVLWLLAAVLVLFVVVLVWATRAKSEEYFAVSEANKAYCVDYATSEAMTRPADYMSDMVGAYAECISVLPARLPIPPKPGTVPAGDRIGIKSSEDPAPLPWREACQEAYRTWDAETETVIRRGSPERVKCPLKLIDGTWQLPPE